MTVDSNYLTAEQAAKALNINLQTLYAYVSRKGVRSLPIPGTRKRRYWKSDFTHATTHSVDRATFH